MHIIQIVSAALGTCLASLVFLQFIKNNKSRQRFFGKHKISDNFQCSVSDSFVMISRLATLVLDNFQMNLAFKFLTFAIALSPGL